MRDMRRSRSPGPTPPTPAFRKARAMVVFWLGVLALLVNLAIFPVADRPLAPLSPDTIEICTGHGMVLLPPGDGSPAAPSGGDDGGHLCALCLPFVKTNQKLDWSVQKSAESRSTNNRTGSTNNWIGLEKSAEGWTASENQRASDDVRTARNRAQRQAGLAAEESSNSRGRQPRFGAVSPQVIGSASVIRQRLNDRSEPQCQAFVKAGWSRRTGS